MKKLVLAIAVASTAAVIMPAVTLAIPPPQNEVTFASRDGNKDGVLSWDEVLGAYPTLPRVLFSQADENDDGVLDEAEFGALQGLSAAFDTDNQPIPF